jgi:hypothetical protein
LHKFFNKAEDPWVDLTWKAYYSATLAPQARSLRDSFGGEICTYCLISRGMAQVMVGVGDTSMFWKEA